MKVYCIRKEHEKKSNFFLMANIAIWTAVVHYTIGTFINIMTH